MSFWNIFELLCQQRHTTAAAVNKELGFSNATATKWKKGSVPKGNTLKKIADYFGVTTDYLLGSETEQKEKPADEGELEKDVVIYHRDGKTVRRKFTKAQLAMISAMLDAIPDETDGNSEL